MAELDRLAFIEVRDGPQAAIDFARRTLGLYRRALLKPRHTFVRPIRVSLHESYHVFKRYLQEHNV